MRGRKPKPDALKVLHGTWQPCRARRAVEAPRGPMGPLKQLEGVKYGLEFWNSFVDGDEADILRPADKPLLHRLCVALALARDASDQLDEAGGVNPYDARSMILHTIVNQQSQIALRLASDLALTPMARRFLR